MATSRARELAEKYAQDGWSGDAWCVSVEGCEGAIRDFAQEMAGEIRAKHILVDSSHWRAALNECANTILDAAGVEHD